MRTQIDFDRRDDYIQKIHSEIANLHQTSPQDKRDSVIFQYLDERYAEVKTDAAARFDFYDAIAHHFDDPYVDTLWRWMQNHVKRISDSEERSEIKATFLSDVYVTNLKSPALFVKRTFEMLRDERSYWAVLGAYDLEPQALRDHFEAYILHLEIPQLNTTEGLQELLPEYPLVEFSDDRQLLSSSNSSKSPAPKIPYSTEPGIKDSRA